MDYDPSVWGPHYWFFMHTIAHIYPKTPNEVTKRKYYDFIQNLPLFIPNNDISDYFIALLNGHPVTPYLDNRDSLIKWMYFIHNKVNVKLGKPEISVLDSLDAYYDAYKPKPIQLHDTFRIHKQIFVYCIIALLIFFIYLTYR